MKKTILKIRIYETYGMKIFTVLWLSIIENITRHHTILIKNVFTTTSLIKTCCFLTPCGFFNSLSVNDSHMTKFF